MPADDADDHVMEPGLSPTLPRPERARIVSIDVVRGVAVLGILAMNIRNFALPIAQFDNPRFALPDGQPMGALDFWSWVVTNLLFEDKMIAIFSLLFGAGLVIFADRLAATGRSRLLHFRRMLWLLMIGLAHAYLMWYGDVLNTYAVCGVLIWPCRRLRAPVLIGLGALVFMVAVWVRAAPPVYTALVTEPGQPVVRTAPGPGRRILQRALRDEEAAYRGGYTGLVVWRANLNTFWHFYGVVSFNLWRCAGFMLIGMGLYKAGLFGAFPLNGLLGLLIGGYSVGLSLTMLGMYPPLAETLERALPSGAGMHPFNLTAWAARYVGAAGLALGHMALVLIVCRWFGATNGARLLAPLAATGRMALTNYLTHTVVCMAIFDGWALGQWGKWRMHEMYALVVAIWMVQLIISPLWMARFAFGPAEWLWRSLTYWRAQPLMRDRA